MSGPTITVRHDEDAIEHRTMASAHATRVGLDVHAEITYTPDQTHQALEAVDRLAADLRRQIADAAEGAPA
ncbi:MAG: hypothetical protein HOQ27_11380 [Dermatophilaceae bacterium]|nr:hypothetical protein [Dermatophilaceae bacterium]